MKILFTLLSLLVVQLSSAQSIFPAFLKGLWKIEGKEQYERWDQLNEKTLKGFSYKTVNGQMRVTEYLGISQNNDEIVYSATVIGQNNGKTIDFKLNNNGNIYSFENSGHDFPKKIVYERISETEIRVLVSDGKQKQFSYKMFQQKTIRDSTVANPDYDAALAAKLGSDDYGMKSYFFVILKTGPNKTTDKEFISKSFSGHMENINRLVDEGKLIVAGPFGKNDKDFRGLFILSGIATLEEAGKLLQSDPAVSSGLLEADIFNWYGSAALAEYLPFSDKIWKTKP